jgi:hypothetical protein
MALSAVINGNLDELISVHKNGYLLTELCTYIAVQYGHIDCLKYLHENDCFWNERTSSNAASNGHLECLKYAHENGCPWDKETLLIAVHEGHLDCVKYFLDIVEHDGKYVYWDYGGYMCYYAAYNGHIDVLQHIHKRGYPWDDRTTIQASGYGQLECLKYAYENGCPLPLDKCLSECRLIPKITDVKNEECIIFLETIIKRNKACVKIQAAFKGMITRNHTGVHNPHCAIGRKFLLNIFNSQ